MGKAQNVEIRHKFEDSCFELSTDYKLLWDLIFKGNRIPAYVVHRKPKNKYDDVIWDLVEVKKK